MSATAIELKKFCEEKEPKGVILLTGEWGCGKTYFIEHELKEAIKDSSVIFRISLFGITSQDEVRLAVKQAWLAEKTKDLNWIENAKRVKKAIENTGVGKFFPEFLGDILSFDVKTIISDTHEIDNKKVVLVFDDLERCTMDSLVILGIINEYFENEKYPVIVVANENKIKDTKDEKSYFDIKEKVVSRTIEYMPDFEEIINSIIGETAKNTEYNSFLKKHSKRIQMIFAPESINGTEANRKDRMHNLRSLKSALNSFERVYTCLCKQGISNIGVFFDPFLQYVLAYKMGRTTEIRELYPDYQRGYMMNAVRLWIERGIWNEDDIQRECKEIEEKHKTYDLSRSIMDNSVLDLDQEITEEIFQQYVDEIYEGNLYADEYILFIENNSMLRKCGYKIYHVDWNKVALGIQKQAESMIEKYDINFRLFNKHHRIADIDGDDFIEEERTAYKLICEEFADENLKARLHRKLYMERLNNAAAIYFDDLKINIFDESMAEKTFEVFKKLTNRERHSFIEIFYECWDNNIKNRKFEKTRSREGFVELNRRLQEMEETNRQSDYHRNRLIKLVEQLISNMEES